MGEIDGSRCRSLRAVAATLARRDGTNHMIETCLPNEEVEQVFMPLATGGSLVSVLYVSVCSIDDTDWSVC